MSARGPVGHTCPKIDSVISAVSSAIKRCYEGDHDGAADDLADVERIMEVIRDANNQLREWGSEQEDLAYDKGKEVEKLEDEISDLKIDLSDLKRELEASLAEQSCAP